MRKAIKIEELIEKLQELQKSHPNIEVYQAANRIGAHQNDPTILSTPSPELQEMVIYDCDGGNVGSYDLHVLKEDYKNKPGTAIETKQILFLSGRMVW